MNGKFVCVALLATAVSGCMTFNQSLLKVPDVRSAGSVVIELRQGDLQQSLNGEGDHRGLADNKNMAKQTATLLLSRWKSEGFVAEYGTAGDLKRPADYAMTLSGQRNEEASIFGAVMSGLTLLLIPNTATITTEVKVDLEDLKSGKHYTSAAKNAFSSTTHLLFLPAFFLGPLGAVHSVNDLADVIAADFQRQGAFH